MRSRLLTLGETLGLAAVYFYCGAFGLSLAVVHKSATAVWPATGLALAVLLLRGYRLWPGVFIGALAINIYAEDSVAVAAGMAVGNTLEALVGAWFLRRFAGGIACLETTRNVFRFVFLAAMVSTAISPTLGVTSLCLGGSAQWYNYLNIWLTWWLGDIVSNLIIAPLILTWMITPLERPRPRQAAEAAGLVLLVLFVGAIVFLEKHPFGTRNYPLEYLAIPPLLWAAFRFRERGAVTFSFLMSAIALWGTLQDLGPFARLEPHESLLLLQTFMGTITMTALVLASIISERQRAEEMRATLAGIVESSEDAIISRTLEGIITSWNAGAERLFGYTPEEMIGASVTRIIPADRQAEESGILNRLNAGQTIQHYESVRRAKDGRLVDVSLTISLIRDASGRPVGASKIARDITLRKRAEAALRHSEALFRQLADAMPQIVWAARPDGYIDYYNQRWYDFTGFPEGYGEESWKPILHPDDLQRCLDTYFQCIREERPYQIEYRFKDRHHGGYRWFLGRALPVRNESGRIIRWFGTCTDIDEQKRTEQTLAETQQVLRQHTETLEKRVQERTAKLQDTVRSLDSVCYSIAHDLRAPLRALGGFSNELTSEYGGRLDDIGRDYLRRIKESAGRMDRLILDLLELGRLNTIEFNLEAVHFEPLIQKALIPLEQAIKQRAAQIEIKAPLTPVYASPVLVEQVLANLIGNGLKFVSSSSAPRLEIWTEKRESMVRLWVKDNGIGMKPQHLAKIFQPFVRLVNGADFPGTGIGLAIVRKGVERMGGQVGVESEFGKGSSFWVELRDAEL